MPAQETKYVDLKGAVLGYLAKQYTRPLPGGDIFLKIHIHPPNKPVEIYSTLEEKDMLSLRERHPDVYGTIFEAERQFKTFDPKKVDNPEAEFVVNKVPVGWWCYIVAVRFKEGEYDITQDMGRNGLGDKGEIKGDALKNTHGTLEDIIVPVEDIWWKETFPPGKSSDPPTDPDHVIWGIRKPGS